MQRQMRTFKEECEWKQMTPSTDIVEQLDIWIKKIEELTDDSRAKFDQLLKDKREEYALIVGKKPFMAWWYAQLDSELQKWMENQRLFKENEAALIAKPNSHKWKMAKKNQ